MKKILYGLVANESVARLFLAGVVPGLLQALMLGMFVVLYSLGQRDHSDQEFALLSSFPERAKLSFLLLAGLERGVFDMRSLRP